MEADKFQAANAIIDDFSIEISLKGALLQIFVKSLETGQIFFNHPQAIEEINKKHFLSPENLYDLLSAELSYSESFQAIKFDRKGCLTCILKMNQMIINLVIQMTEKPTTEIEKLTTKCDLMKLELIAMKKQLNLERKSFVPNGLYRIRSIMSEKYIGVKNYSLENCRLFSHNFDTIQDPIVQNFLLERCLDGNYKIIVQHSGKVIEVDSKEKIQQADFENTDKQFWNLHPLADQSFCIISKETHQALSSLDIGKIVQSKTYGALEKHKSTIFRLIPENLPSNGHYYVQTKSGIYLKAEENAFKNCVRILTGKESEAMHFGLKQTKEGFFKILVHHTDKVLDVKNISKKDDAIIFQYTYWNGPNQQWRLVEFQKGYYFIIARHSGKCLTASEDGSVVQRTKSDDAKRMDFQLFCFKIKNTI